MAVSYTHLVDLHIFLRDYLNMIVLRVLDENQRNSRLEAQMCIRDRARRALPPRLHRRGLRRPGAGRPGPLHRGDALPVPSDKMGDVMGDLQGRRAMIMGMRCV